MTKPLPNNPVSPLREKLIGGMNMATLPRH